MLHQPLQIPRVPLSARLRTRTTLTVLPLSPARAAALGRLPEPSSRGRGGIGTVFKHVSYTVCRRIAQECSPVTTARTPPPPEISPSLRLELNYIIRGETGYTHSLSPSRPRNNTLNTRQQRTQVQGHISHTRARADRRAPQKLRVRSGRGRHYTFPPLLLRFGSTERRAGEQEKGHDLKRCHAIQPPLCDFSVTVTAELYVNFPVTAELRAILFASPPMQGRFLFASPRRFLFASPIDLSWAGTGAPA